MSDTKRDIDGLIAALGHQKQCDEEGVLIAVSRQAVDEAMAALSDIAAERERADRNQEDAELYRSLIDATEINSDSFYWSRNEKAKSATIVAEMNAIFGMTEE